MNTQNQRRRVGDEKPANPATKRDHVADHARRTLRKLGLSPEAARNVVRALQLSGVYYPFNEGPRKPDGSFDLSKLSHGLPESMTMGQLLGRTFRWHASAVALGLPSRYFGDVHRAHAEYGVDAGAAA